MTAITAERRWACLLFGLLGAAVVGTSVTVEGPIISYGGDAFYYLCDAYNFAHGNGFRDCNELPLRANPPFVPFVLSLPLMAGAGVIDWVRVICTLFAGLTAYASARLLAMGAASRAAFLMGSFTIATLPTLALWGSVGATTDPFLIGLGVAQLLTTVLYLRGGSGILPAALVGALCLSVRTFGLAATAAAGLAVLLPPLNPRPLKARLRDAVVYGLVAGGPFALWIGRNLAETGCAFGCANLPGDTTPFRSVLRDFLFELSGWHFYLPSLQGIRPLLIAVAMAAVVAVGSVRRGATSADQRGVWWTTLLYAAIYCAMVLAVFGTVPKAVIERMNHRYALPMAPVFMLLTFLALDRLVGLRRWLTGAAVVVWGLWMVAPLRSTWATMVHHHGFFAAGPTSTSRLVSGSELLAYLRESLPAADVWAANSDTTTFVLMHTGRLLPNWMSAPPGENPVIVWVDAPGGVAMGGAMPYLPPPDFRVIHSSRFGKAFGRGKD